jgi:hypothetical protein
VASAFLEAFLEASAFPEAFPYPEEGTTSLLFERGCCCVHGLFPVETEKEGGRGGEREREG